MGRLNWKCLTWLFTSAAVTIFLQPADKKICTVGDRCSLLPEMLAGHYHILFLLWRHPESACQARRDPGPTELDSREAERRSKFMLDSSRGFNERLSPLLHRTLSCCTELRKQCNRPQGRMIFDVHDTVNCKEFGEGKEKKASPTETISSFTVISTL